MLRARPLPFVLVLIVSLATGLNSAASAPYQTGFTRWEAASRGFAGWTRSGVALAADGALQLDALTVPRTVDPQRPGSYYGHNFYNGGAFWVGTATSPVMEAAFRFGEAIVSWNAETPAGTWIEAQMRAQAGAHWTAWYTLGVWAADAGTIARHSVSGQRDADGQVDVDTLILSPSKPPATAFQVRFHLFTTDRAVSPSVHRAGVAISTMPQPPQGLVPGDPHQWNRVLTVPACSQMVYPNGGESWCSPTSTAMVVGYWEHATGACAPQVRAAVNGVYDWRYAGHGNWPFNTAYAGTHTLVGYVARFTSLAQAERWIAAGVPLILSYGWNRGELTGAPLATSSGHLVVLIGFDAAGNPIINDPAAPGDATVRRTYQRTQLETLWLAHSGGTVYLIYPPGWPVPAL